MIQDHFNFRVNYIRCWESQNDWHLSPDLHSWPPKSRSNILSNDLYYLWLNTCYKLDFDIDFNIFDIEELKQFKINNVIMMVDLENDTNLEKVGLTLKIKVNHQSSVTENRFSEILDIENVKIDTNIESIASIQPEVSKVIWRMCMTLSFKVERLRYVNYFDILDIPGLEIVRIDTKIMSVWCLQPEIRKVIHKCVWPLLSRSTIKVMWLILGFLRSTTLRMLESTPRSSL